MPKSVHRPGFTLIEVVLSLFLILTLVTILLTTSSTFISSRGSNLQGIAAKIASRQIETLRKTDFASLPPSGSVTDPDLAKLPSSSATQTVSDYQGNSQIKQVTVQVDWTVSGAVKQIKMETLIYQYGL